MRFDQQEKYEIIRLVEGSELGVNRTLKELGIHKSTFYQWYGKYLEKGYDGLVSVKRNTQWNRIPPDIRQRIVELALELPDRSPRELAHIMIDHQKYFISESSVYRILKAQGLITSPAYMVMQAADEFTYKTTRVNQLWQTDFTYLKVIGWGWYYLSTIMDDYSRYIISWELCSTMNTDDVERSIEMALERTGLKNAPIRPKLLSDNGPCYISGQLKTFMEDVDMKHVRGRPMHPQTQGKIERYHRSMKNVIKLEHYYSPNELQRRLAEFIEYYNDHRYHESLNNCTPADVFLGRHHRIIKKREQIKERTMRKRRKQYQLSKMKTIS